MTSAVSALAEEYENAPQARSTAASMARYGCTRVEPELLLDLLVPGIHHMCVGMKCRWEGDVWLLLDACYASGTAAEEDRRVQGNDASF